MRPVDLLIIGMLMSVIGRIEQVRDGRDDWSAKTVNVLGLVASSAGWVWFLSSVGWFS